MNIFHQRYRTDPKEFRDGDVCHMPPLRGAGCEGEQTKWTFDYGSCTPGDCSLTVDGASNLFDTFADCAKACRFLFLTRRKYTPH